MLTVEVELPDQTPYGLFCTFRQRICTDTLFLMSTISGFSAERHNAVCLTALHYDVTERILNQTEADAGTCTEKRASHAVTVSGIL